MTIGPSPPQRFGTKSAFLLTSHQYGTSVLHLLMKKAYSNSLVWRNNSLPTAVFCLRTTSPILEVMTFIPVASWSAEIISPIISPNSFHTLFISAAVAAAALLAAHYVSTSSGDPWANRARKALNSGVCDVSCSTVTPGFHVTSQIDVKCLKKNPRLEFIFTSEQTLLFVQSSRIIDNTIF